MGADERSEWVRGRAERAGWVASGVSGAGGERSERGLVPWAAQLALFILAIARSGRVRTEVALGVLAISCGYGLTHKGQRTHL